MGELLLHSPGRAFFSERTPTGLRYLLSAAQALEHPHAVEALLLEGLRRWAEEPDAHIGLYKFYFFHARYREAEIAVWRALHSAASSGGFRRNYRRLQRADADWQQRAGAERLYLFSLKALGLIRLRRGRVRDARRVLEKLLELDPFDEIGGAAFLQIACSFSEDEG